MRSLLLRIPAGAAPAELIIPTARRVRLEGANVYGKGFKGAIVVEGEEMPIAPDVDFVLTAADGGAVNSIDLAVGGPFAVQWQTDQDLELRVEAGRPTLTELSAPPAVEYRFRAPGRARGVIRAQALTLEQAKEFSFADRLVNTVRIVSDEDTPLGFSATADGGESRMLVFFGDTSPDRTVQRLRAAAGSVVLTGTSGRLLAGGRQSVGLTGLEDVDLRGQLEITDLEVGRDHIGVSVTGTARELFVEHESIMPTVLGQLASRPLWTTGFVIAMVLWTAIMLPVMRLLLTGSWGNG